MLKNNIKLLSTILIICFAMGLSACSSGTKYKDGTYTAQSVVVVGKEDEAGVGDGYGKATITILDNKIIACSFILYTNDDNEKNSDFGKEDGEIKKPNFFEKVWAFMKKMAIILYKILKWPFTLIKF